MDSGQKAAVEIIRTASGNHAVAKDDVARKLLVIAAQAVSDPGTDTGFALRIRAGVEKEVGVGVLGKIANHRADDGDVVNTGADVREDFANGCSTFAARDEFPR